MTRSTPPPAPKLPALRFEPCLWCGAEVTGYKSFEQRLDLDNSSYPVVAIDPVDRWVTLYPCGHTVRGVRLYSREP